MEAQEEVGAEVSTDHIRPVLITVPVANLVDDPDNEPHAVSEAENERFCESIRASGGPISPPVVRVDPASPAFARIIIAGHRRVAACRALGIEFIDVIQVEVTDPAEIHAIRLADNTARAPLSLPGMWLSMKRLVARGRSLQQAADALGITMSMARRVYLLGSMHPTVLEAMTATGIVPDNHELRIIAQAPQDVQAEAMKSRDAWTGSGKNRTVHWRFVANQCRTTRIPKTWAIFDKSDAPLPSFEDDLFAQAGETVVPTTAEVDVFLDAQRRALDRIVGVHHREDRPVVILDAPPDYVRPNADGMISSGNLDPKKPKAWPQPSKDNPQTVGLYLRTSGYEIGLVSAHAMRMKPKPERQPRDQAQPDSAPRPKASVTTKGQTLISQQKTLALRQAITEWRDTGPPPAQVLHVLLLALCGNTVKLYGGAHRMAPIDPSGILPALLGADDAFVLPSDGDLAMAAGDILSRILVCPPGEGRTGDDAVADTIARALFFPPPAVRYDEWEILKECSADVLADAVRSIGIKPAKSARDRITQLVDSAPDWRPPGGAYDALINPPDVSGTDEKPTNQETE